MTDEVEANDTDRFVAARVELLAEQGILSSYPDDPESWAVEYLADELVVDAGDAGALAEELARLDVPFEPLEGEPADEVDGTVGYRIGSPGRLRGDLDPRRLVVRINEERAANGLVPLTAAAHHVPSIARTKIGPGSDPWPAEPDASWRAGDEVTDAPPIGIVDTGVWEAVPTAIADAGGSDGRDPVDDSPPVRVIDYPGAAHGGFIAGVVDATASGIPLISRRGFVPGRPFMTERSVRRAGDEAIGAGARILNLSLGTYATDAMILSRAVRRWVGEGCLVVAAAGNEGTDQRWYPAGFATAHELDHGVVSVGACMDGEIAPFSNHGDWVVCWAPGWGVLGHYPVDVVFPYRPNGTSAPFSAGLARWSGTSFAAPVVAAEVARYAAERGLGPDVQGAWAEMRRHGAFRGGCAPTKGIKGDYPGRSA